jgi:hypothetical protein
MRVSLLVFFTFSVCTTIVAAVTRPTDCCSADATFTWTMHRIHIIIHHQNRSSSPRRLVYPCPDTVAAVYLVLWVAIFPFRVCTCVARFLFIFSRPDTSFTRRLLFFSPRVIYVHTSTRARETQWKYAHKNMTGRLGDKIRTTKGLRSAHCIIILYAAGTMEIRIHRNAYKL